MEQPILSLSYMPGNREAGSSIRSLPLAVAVTAVAQQAWHGQSSGIRMAAVLPRKPAATQSMVTTYEKAESIPTES